MLKKIWTELTRLRAIEFISYETEQEQNERLAKEFKNRVRHFQRQNEQYAIEKLTAWVIHQTLEKDNYLIGEKQARPEAIKLYKEAKMYGRLDQLNRVIGA